MTKLINVLNTITGKVGAIPEKLFNSNAFNQGQLEPYDGPVNPDCGCPSVHDESELEDVIDTDTNPEDEE